MLICNSEQRGKVEVSVSRGSLANGVTKLILSSYFITSWIITLLKTSANIHLDIAPSKPIQKNTIGTLNKSWILQHSLPLKNCSNKNVCCNSSTPRAIFNSKFFRALSSWGNNDHDRATVHRTPFSLEQLSTIFTAWVTRLL